MDRYNTEVRKHNQKARRAVDDYNRAARQHNTRVRQNQQRRKQALRKLQSGSRVRVTETRTIRIDRGFESVLASPGSEWLGDHIVDLAEREVVNSAEVSASMEREEPTNAVGDLTETSISTELSSVDVDLDARWKGALYSLNAENPDATRHFCTSARELLASLLETLAPDGKVIANDPDCPKTDQGSVSRRARIMYLVSKQEGGTAELVDFVQDDIDDVVQLFGEVNSGTHGRAGKLSLDQLHRLKIRVEGAIQFVCAVATPVNL